MVKGRVSQSLEVGGITTVYIASILKVGCTLLLAILSRIPVVDHGVPVHGLAC